MGEFGLQKRLFVVGFLNLRFDRHQFGSRILGAVFRPVEAENQQADNDETQNEYTAAHDTSSSFESGGRFIPSSASSSIAGASVRMAARNFADRARGLPSTSLS